MRILIVGTHAYVRQPSMALFAEWLYSAAAPLGETRLTCAPAVCLSRSRAHSGVAKWLAYLDQYLLLTVLLWWRSLAYDLVVVADHSNAPSSVLVPRNKLVVMVHDTIAFRQALGQIKNAPRAPRTGVILQSIIQRSVRRAKVVLSNPGTIPEEIKRLKLAKTIHVVGCPIDYSRLKPCSNSTPPATRYVLNVASDGWRKRKQDLVALWAEVQARCDLHLVLAGHTAEETRTAFADAGVTNLTILNDVSNGDLASLYQNCAALISSSHEEGLCIPVMEALYFDKRVFVPQIGPSYVDFFGPAVTPIRIDEPKAAAEELVRLLQVPVSPEAVAAVKAWAALPAFNQRVQDALKPYLRPANRVRRASAARGADQAQGPTS